MAIRCAASASRLLSAVGLALGLSGLLGCSSGETPTAADRFAAAPRLLSQWGLFDGAPADLEPAPGVVPYDVNTPLFSDYTAKYRFVRLPEGGYANYVAAGAFTFPVGTVIAKTFAYPLDRRDPQKGRRILETRLLLHEDGGWIGLPYIWNEEQSDAELALAGERLAVSWIDESGELRRHDGYLVPNANQCKGCHRPSGHRMSPLGPRADELNRELCYPEGSENQLVYWTRIGILDGTPALQGVARLPVWDDPSTGDVEKRARAWLDVNCAHCHNPQGAARTTGLDLSYVQQDPTLLGVYKYPVAAGRGSGDDLFGIAPGHPESSILVYRLRSTDPGVMMPELGRGLVHEEGVALVEEWIRTMPDPRAVPGS